MSAGSFEEQVRVGVVVKEAGADVNASSWPATSTGLTFCCC
jgi:hypothetical protein